MKSYSHPNGHDEIAGLGCYCPLFVIFQRRNFHQGGLGVGPMHRLAIVPQSLLRESFRVANGLGPFRPSGLDINK